MTTCNLGCQQPSTESTIPTIKDTNTSVSTQAAQGNQPGKIQLYGPTIESKTQNNVISYALQTGTGRNGEEVSLNNDRLSLNTTPLLNSSQLPNDNKTLLFGCTNTEVQSIQGSSFPNQINLSTTILSTSNTFQAETIIICSENINLGKYSALSAKNIILKDVILISTTEAGASRGSFEIYTENLKLIGENEIQMLAYQSPGLRKAGPSFSLSITTSIQEQSNSSLLILSKGASWPLN